MEPIQVEKLLRYDGASRNSTVEDMPAASRLQYLAENFSKGTNPKPMIIFGTVELVTKPLSLAALSSLSSQGILKRIIVDEFDVVEESNETFRKAYVDIFPRLRESCRCGDGRAIQLIALSATVTNYTIVLSRESADRSSRAKLFLTDRALPDCHTYSVERKASDEQVRIFR
jgi:superfamily II DNA helicase RecQ